MSSVPNLNLEPFFVASSDRVLDVRGEDAESWLQGQVTCDLRKRNAAKAEASYGLILNPKGRIVADAWMAPSPSDARDEEFPLWQIAVPSQTVQELLVRLEHYIIMEDVELAAREDSHVTLLFADEDQIPESFRKNLLRTSRGGRTSFEWWLPQAETQRLRDALRDRSVREESEEYLGQISLLELTPRFGPDFGETTYPQEVGLEKAAVSFQKGCYLGQEVICMLENRGQVSRRLVQLSTHDGKRTALEAGSKLDLEGEEVGTLQQVVHLSDRSVATAIIKAIFLKPDTKLVVRDVRHNVPLEVLGRMERTPA